VQFVETNQIRYYYFANLQNGEIDQAVFSRRGGVSPEPWDSLNMGATVGDDIERVKENRTRAFSVFAKDPCSMFDVWQVHSNQVICTNDPRPYEVTPQKADAIITNKNHVTLFMRFADCVPIFLFDKRKKVIGLVHAGWLGTVNRVVENAVQRMKNEYNSSPKDIYAGIGPSIGPDHYEIGQDVINAVDKNLSPIAQQILKTKNDVVHMDLWAANQLLLERNGVTQIEISEICTACHLEDWFSHRGEHGKTGRFGALISLKS
jgi:YfiH family protein